MDGCYARDGLGWEDFSLVCFVEYAGARGGERSRVCATDCLVEVILFDFFYRIFVEEKGQQKNSKGRSRK